MNPVKSLGVKALRGFTSTALRTCRDGRAGFTEKKVSIPVGSGALTALAFEPESVSEGDPLIVFFHGGGFLCCGIDTHADMAARIALASGLRVVLSSYRLAPEHAYPAQLEDALDIVEHFGREGLSGRAAASFILAGDSAGGFLAVAAAASRPDVVGQFLIYPLLHLDPGLWKQGKPALARSLGRAAVPAITKALGVSDVGSLNMLEQAASHTPPTLILTAANDPTRPDTDAYATALKALGVPVKTIMEPKGIHGGYSLASVSRHISRSLDHAAAELADFVATNKKTT